MPFDLSKLKDKLDSGTLAELTSHVEDLESRASRTDVAEEKARKAVRESIEGRKTLKAERDKAFEKLGISEADELETLPDAKGQGEATKQLEAQVKKLTRERDEAVKARDELGGTLKSMKRETALAAALEGHRFKNPADVRVLLQSRVVEEGDDLLFKTDDGKQVALKDGVAWFATTRPDYVEAKEGGGQGSGFGRGANGGQGGNAKTMTRAEFDAATHAQRAEFAKSGGQVIDA